MTWRRRLEPFARPFYRAYWRVSRGLTLGVRAVATNAAGEVLLVEHTYSRGLHLPGGGVERGETAEAALARELVEEAGLIVTAEPRLIGIYTGLTSFVGDHVLCFRIEAWRQGEATARGEILRTLWAAPDALPDGSSRLTRRLVADTMGLPSP